MRIHRVSDVYRTGKLPSLQAILFQSGDLFLPKSVRAFLEHYYVGSDTSLVYITNWTFIHFLVGVVLARYLYQTMTATNTLWRVFWIHTLWELWQIIGRNTPIHTARGILDIGMDTFATMFGAWLTIKVLVAK
jgi:hypothetical protein